MYRMRKAWDPNTSYFSRKYVFSFLDEKFWCPSFSKHVWQPPTPRRGSSFLMNLRTQFFLSADECTSVWAVSLSQNMDSHLSWVICLSRGSCRPGREYILKGCSSGHPWMQTLNVSQLGCCRQSLGAELPLLPPIKPYKRDIKMLRISYEGVLVLEIGLNS